MARRSRLFWAAQRVSGPALLAIALATMTPTYGGAQAWLPQSLTGGPAARTGQSAVLDTNTQDMIVFGGLTGSPSSPAESNEVWVLQHGSTPEWVQMTPAGGPPTARDSQAAAYDSNTGTMIVFGGKNSVNSCFGDTWLLEGANGGSPTWTQVTGSGPSARFGASAVYDWRSNEVILFGGECANTPHSDVWILHNANGTGGTPTWAGPFPGAVPPRAYHSAGYDPNANTMTIFGGSNVSADLNDTWVLTNANGTGSGGSWTQLTSYGLPPARSTQSTVYDPKLNRLMIFGGTSSGAPLNDAWVLYNANGTGAIPIWISLNFLGSEPSVRAEASAVYDYNSGNAIFFGGSGTTSFLNDVWTLQNATGIGVNTWDGGRPGDERLIGDFDGDGKDDFVVWRPSNATWYILPSSGAAPIMQQWGLPGDIPVPADYDGDGKTDFAVWRPSQAIWYIKTSSGPNLYPNANIQQQWGLPGDIPIVGDFDGDGKIDFAVWRPSQAIWYVKTSSGPNLYPNANIQQQWGLPGDIPLVGDFDGDGKTDFTVWRPSQAIWYVKTSSGPDLYPNANIQQQWGLPGDIPLVGDFDGDGKIDFAVWRPPSAVWYIKTSSGPNLYPNANIQQQWGFPGDVPVTGDFDGDHKTDLGIWRPSYPSFGTWFILTSSGPNNYPSPNLLQQWGLPGDGPF